MAIDECSHCGGPLRRSRRRFWEHALFSAAYECRDCHRRTYAGGTAALFLPGPTRCPRCGTSHVVMLTHRDGIDAMYNHPLSRIQALLGARIHHCAFCRLQYYDLRKLRPKPKPAPPIATAAEK